MITEDVTERTITPEDESRVVTADGQEQRSINLVDSRGGSVNFRHVSTEPEQYRLLQDGEERRIANDQTEYRVVREAVQGPAGTPGAPGADGIGDLHEIHVGPIASGNAHVIDSIAIADYRSCKWVVTVTDPTAMLYRMSEVMAIHNGDTPTHTHYGMIGDSVQYGVEITINNGYFRLSVENRHANSIHVSAIRLPTTKQP